MVEEKKLTKEELLKKAELPNRQAMTWHPFYRGKVEVMAKCAIPDFDAFGVWYTPGVAASCKAIHKNPELSYEHTNRANTIAVVSDGTRVLGLGDIGPVAGMPVMEGKALLFKYLGGVDAFPLTVNTKDPDKIIEFVELLAPSVAGINLEDISQPKCFYVLDTLRENNIKKNLGLCIWHDDQQGTASITAAAAINAIKLTGIKKEDVLITYNGAGSANIAISRVMVAAGFSIENMVMCDSKGILSQDRADQFDPDDWRKFPDKYKMCTQSNKDGKTGGLVEACEGTHMLISCSVPVPGTINADHIKVMADKPTVMACANPLPEIFPWDAKEAGAYIVATGRSDFPNQVNNSLGFPGIFRGALDVRATTITDEMTIAAALELAKHAEEAEYFDEEHIVPTMDDWEIFPREAAAVGMKAIEQNVARLKFSRDELYKIAEKKIQVTREKVQNLQNNGFIKMPPKID
ncbi:MAG: NADP-dependent malic enzyme [Promethearchaeota archaeon]